MLVQARQLFGFMLAEQRGWRAQGLAEELAASADWFVDNCFRPDGLAGRRIDIERGLLLDDRPTLYDNAFCLLALAQGRKILGEARAGTLIGQLLGSLDRHLGLAEGDGWRESIPAPKRRLQNPHMHLFEALLVLYDQTRSDAAHRRAEALLGFIGQRFFDRQGHLVREAVLPGAQADEAGGNSAERTQGGGDGHIGDQGGEEGYEPGHSMEWVWLLGYRARLFGAPLHEFALPLYQRACAASTGAARTPMRLAADNSPIDANCRLWAQAESLKAHLCMFELGPPNLAAAAGERSLACAEAILGRWLVGVAPGGWMDRVGADGKPAAETMPASTGYHLFLAISELSRVAGRPLP